MSGNEQGLTLQVGSYTIEQRPGGRWGAFRGGMRIGRRWADSQAEALGFIEDDARERIDEAMDDLQHVAGQRVELQRQEIEAREGVAMMATPFGFVRADRKLTMFAGRAAGKTTGVGLLPRVRTHDDLVQAMWIALNNGEEE